MPCTCQLPKLFSYHFLTWNSLSVPLGLTNILLTVKISSRATYHKLSFPPPSAHIDLPHLSLYSLGPRSFSGSVTQFSTSVRTVEYSLYVLVLLLHVLQLLALEPEDDCLWLLRYTHHTPCLTRVCAHAYKHTHTHTSHPNPGHCLCPLSSHPQSPPQPGALLFFLQPSEPWLAPAGEAHPARTVSIEIGPFCQRQCPFVSPCIHCLLLKLFPEF